MQNEKQTKIFKVHEKLKILRKKFDQQTKGTPWRKMFPQTWQYQLRMTSWKQKKIRETERKRSNEKLFIWCPKPLDQKLEKFLPHLISRGDCKTSGEKRRWKRFRALRSKRSGWGLRLNLGGLKRLWFILESHFDELCTKQNLKHTNENLDTFENGGFPLPKF